MRLNWFSPLPPAKSAIAGYAATVIPALAARADVRLWTDQEELDPAIATLARVHRFAGEPAWDEVNRGAMSLFHIGNQGTFHRRIWQASRAHPGVVVLHDSHLHHLFAAGLFHDEPDDAYRAAMERYHGARGRQDADALARGLLTTDAMAVRYPLTGLAVERALGVLVHTEQAAGAVTAAGFAGPARTAALPYLPAVRPAARPPRPAPPCRLICFGHIGPNRRLDAVLEALARFGRSDELRLDVYGEMSQPQDFLDTVARLGLAGRVTAHGYVDEATLDRALAAAHLAVNLRYPTMGEASWSQLRIWDHALPSLVTRVGWYADLPEDAVVLIRPEHETADLLAAFAALLAAPERFDRMGEAGRLRLERVHALPAYLDALLAVVDAARAYRPVAAWRELGERAAKALLPLAGVTPDRAARPVPAPDLDPFHFAVARHRIESERQHLAALARVRRALGRDPSPEPQEGTLGSATAAGSAASDGDRAVSTVRR